MKWEDYYEMVKRYQEENKTNYIPVYYEENNIKLGIWCSKQRIAFRKNKLSKDRINKLNSIDFLFEIKSGYNTSIPEQVLYYYIQQHFNNANNRDKSNGFELDIYFEYNNKKIGIEYNGLYHRNRIKEDIEKVKKCKKNNIFIFEIRDWNCNSLSFQDKYYYEYLLKDNFFKTKDYSEFENIILKMFKDISNILNIDVKVDINIKRDMKNIINNYCNICERKWMNNFLILKEMYNKRQILSDAIVRWSIHQRKLYKENLLNNKKIALLEDIGFSWEPTLSWEQSFQLASEYFDIHKEINIHRNTVFKEFALGRWVESQRSAYKKGKLSNTQISLLQSLDIIWDIPDSKWLENYGYLKEYYQENGNINIKVNFNYKEKNIGKFLAHQRENFKNGTLTAERLILLNKIGFQDNLVNSVISNHLDNDSWNEKYILLENYYIENGNLNIPCDYIVNNIKLGKFLANAKYDYRKNKLLPERYEKLKLIGFDECLGSKKHKK